MKIIAFVGSARKGYTYAAAEKLLHNLHQSHGIEYELVRLSEYRLEICRGCKACIDKGEEHCPLQDDGAKLIQKMLDSDGVVFATPNYSFQVSGLMKVFLDRFGYLFHRPRMFGKISTSIVAQAIYGGKKIVNYLDFIGKALGCNVVSGFSITTLEPVTEQGQQKIDKTLAKQRRRIGRQMGKRGLRTPSLFELMLFRMSRSSIRLMLDENYRDYTWYEEQGWFDSDFYYPVRLNPLKKLVGRLFDAIGRSVAKK